MRTTEEILKYETDIIKAAEADCEIDPYYLKLFNGGSYEQALAYKYGRTTMNLAMQIKNLNKKL